MAQAVAAESAIGQWYLFMGDGICLKVSSDLYLGEDADGLLVLNPKSPASVLLQVKKDESGRLLIRNVSKRHVLDFETGNATMVGEELSLLSGSKIVLPHNELYFNHEMQRGKISARIALKAVAEQTGPIEVLVEVVPEFKQKIAPRVVETQALEPAHEEAPAGAIAGAIADTVAESILVQEVFTEPKVVADVPMGQAAAYRKRFLALSVIALTAVLAAVLVAVLVDDKPLAPADQLVEELITPEPITSELIAPELIAPERVTQEQLSELQVAEVQAADIPDAELPIAAAALPEVQPESMIPANPVDAEAARQTAERLERAISYLDQGFITLPRQTNAVRELSLVLWADPTNQDALLLMSDAADRLVDAAVEAQAAGLEFEARNLLEEVLGFHPEHQQANAYWRRWTGLDR